MMRWRIVSDDVIPSLDMRELGREAREAVSALLREVGG